MHYGGIMQVQFTNPEEKDVSKYELLNKGKNVFEL